MVKIAMDLLRQGMIDEKTALMRVEPNKLDELLHPVFDKDALKKAKILTRGLPASPGLLPVRLYSLLMMPPNGVLPVSV